MSDDGFTLGNALRITRSNGKDAIKRADLARTQRDDLLNRLNGVLDDIEAQHECPHDDVVAHINPKTLERPLGDTIDPAEEGTQSAHHAKCQDCGAELSCAIELTFDRGDDDA